MAKKSTDAEVQRRINDIYHQIIIGSTYTDIVEYCRQNYKVTAKKTVARYLNGAKEIIKKIALPEQEEARKEAIAFYNKILKEAYESGQIKEARHIRTRLDKIQGLEIENINVRTDGLTFPELEKEILKVHREAKKHGRSKPK